MTTLADELEKLAGAARKRRTFNQEAGAYVGFAAFTLANLPTIIQALRERERVESHIAWCREQCASIMAMAGDVSDAAQRMIESTASDIDINLQMAFPDHLSQGE